MNDIRIREMTADETPLLLKWLYEHRKVTQLDLEVYRKNQVQVYVAEDETGILCFIPIQFLYKFDAIGPRPALAAFRLARTFQAMTEFMKDKAAKENIGAVLLQPSDAAFSEFLQSDTLGYERLERETLVMDYNRKSEKACAR